MKIKKPCPEHYILAQIPWMEKYRSLIEKKEGQISNEEFARRYTEDEDKEGLTQSDRYKLQYVKMFLSGKPKVANDCKEWANILKDKASELSEYLKKRKKLVFA